ncbi:HVO_0234 family beta-propeller protein [Haloarcula onubensis]|uniref:HVO-0234-like beta-propeller domain-containing protein n=1 Tax=Haloarcula onubensis TaxID=2950539 RepID=A0ABU2FNZ9_9EURY|nr:hypothetical protein [Halomicroarcula sp. S3CR25-11]MDS0282481.1 hypothetical protein [Halomicroarcula sp. S3CR25-11]
MSDDDISLSEKRMYGQTRPETHAYVASGLGVTRVETAGGQIGRFSLVHRCSARAVAGANGEIAVATAESVLVSTDDGFAATGFGPATAVGYDADGLVAAGEGRVARYDDGEWWEMGAVDDVRALSDDLVAAADGVYGLPGCAYLGLHDAADVAGPYAATADGLYRRDAQEGTVGARENWLPVRSGAHYVVASDGRRVHTADADGLYELADHGGAGPEPNWQPCDLPVRERVVDVAYGADTYAITEDGTFLVDTADDATADGRGGWRARSLGVPEVVGVAVA